MSRILEEILDVNKRYAEQFGDRGNLPMPPKRRFAILTCMDARLDPAKFAGLSEGDAHVVRNAGGRASDDAIRSLVISHKLLGTREWFVIHHTDCGMLTFKDDEVKGAIEKDTGIRPPFALEAFSNVQDDVEQSIARIKSSPFVPNRSSIRGFVYDVKTGRLSEVRAAAGVR